MKIVNLKNAQLSTPHAGSNLTVPPKSCSPAFPFNKALINSLSKSYDPTEIRFVMDNRVELESYGIENTAYLAEGKDFEEICEFIESESVPSEENPIDEREVSVDEVVIPEAIEEFVENNVELIRESTEAEEIPEEEEVIKDEVLNSEVDEITETLNQVSEELK